MLITLHCVRQMMTGKSSDNKKKKNEAIASEFIESIKNAIIRGMRHID